MGRQKQQGNREHEPPEREWLKQVTGHGGDQPVTVVKNGEGGRRGSGTPRRGSGLAPRIHLRERPGPGHGSSMLGALKGRGISREKDVSTAEPSWATPEPRTRKRTRSSRVSESPGVVTNRAGNQTAGHATEHARVHAERRKDVGGAGSQSNGYGAWSNTEGQRNTAEGQTDGPGTGRRRRTSGGERPAPGPGRGARSASAQRDELAGTGEGNRKGFGLDEAPKPGSDDERKSTSVQERAADGRHQSANAESILRRGNRRLDPTRGRHQPSPFLFGAVMGAGVTAWTRPGRRALRCLSSM